MELATKVGGYEIITKIVDDLKDENEQYRKVRDSPVVLVSMLPVSSV